MSDLVDEFTIIEFLHSIIDKDKNMILENFSIMQKNDLRDTFEESWHEVLRKVVGKQHAEEGAQPQSQQRTHTEEGAQPQHTPDSEEGTQPHDNAPPGPHTEEGAQPQSQQRTHTEEVAQPQPQPQQTSVLLSGLKQPATQPPAIIQAAKKPKLEGKPTTSSVVETTAMPNNPPATSPNAPATSDTEKVDID
jgi:hypothetical protein